MKSRSAPPGKAGTVRRYAQDAGRRYAAGDFAGAENAVLCALALAPDDAALLRIAARVQIARGRPDQAIGDLQRVLAQHPNDLDALRDLAAAQTAFADFAGAVDATRRIVALRGDAAAWFELGLALDRNGDCADALAAAERALELDPTNAAARFLIGRSLTGLGRIDDAITTYRALTAIGAQAPKAWFALADLKTVDFSDAELATMASILADARIGDEARMLVDFALGTAYEKRGRAAEAYASVERANAARRRHTRWDAAAHRRTIDAIRDAFAAPVASAPGALGAEVIFIVGMPRSGTTLVEQMLGAHPDIVAASELPHLEAVLHEESTRRGRAFPHWVGNATANDWERLGHRYLERTARWQTARRFTDKLPENWPYVGAALAMLPGARVVGCERDLVETCWSCFKQLFAPNRVAWSYALDDLAAYAHDSRRLWAWWQARDPARCRTLVHEELTADPAREIAALLDFLDLPFDPACLETGRARRVTRTASAAQARAPLQRDTARGARYGELFAPLRAALERAATI
ncbi:tetratricopeptide repeat-containing sulfotransferase family protein [Tahibacter soli]|uniref:Sulfotransferase n=1 Tax=Tahibacter soli TaxID=2983605 RepID=A0A9X3YRJ8_9GAMM|nr:tetratricopeptide repeat-containing sulfotransferase family protein [Tahibacter soli]MDC8015798.1 sulfotransferase [Tahibacter soli]